MQPYDDQRFLSYSYFQTVSYSPLVGSYLNSTAERALLSNVKNNEHSSTDHILITLNKAPRTPRKTSRSHWVNCEGSHLLSCEGVQRGGLFPCSAEN